MEGSLFKFKFCEGSDCMDLETSISKSALDKDCFHMTQWETLLVSGNYVTTREIRF